MAKVTAGGNRGDWRAVRGKRGGGGGAYSDDGDDGDEKRRGTAMRTGDCREDWTKNRRGLDEEQERMEQKKLAGDARGGSAGRSCENADSGLTRADMGRSSLLLPRAKPPIPGGRSFLVAGPGILRTTNGSRQNYRRGPLLAARHSWPRAIRTASRLQRGRAHFISLLSQQLRLIQRIAWKRALCRLVPIGGLRSCCPRPRPPDYPL